MINPTGINLILTDSLDSVKALCDALSVQTAHPLTELLDRCMQEPDAVYYIVGDSLEQLTTLSKNFNIRKGVIFFEGRKHFLGYNREWMTKVLVMRDLDNAISATSPVKITVPAPEDRDDPFEALGYVRR